MSDDIQRRGLAANLATRHRALGFGELRVINLLTSRIEQHRQRHGEMDLGDLGGLVDRLGAGITSGDILDSAISLLARDLAEQDVRNADLHETARAEMFAPVVCSTCGDTHLMTLGDRDVPCTRCPVPCQSCRAPGSGYCRTVRCYCVCHAERQAPVANPFPLLIQVAVPPVRLIDDDPIVVDEFELDQEQRTRLGQESAGIALNALNESSDPYDELAVEWGIDIHAGEGP